MKGKTQMTKIKAGLLPLYIKLYDDASPNMRPKIDAFHALISERLSDRGLEVVDVPVCRVKPEFEAAIKKFEDSDCDVIITLHLAYSPSLESSDALAATKLPIVVLDTTPDYVYKPETDPDALSYNHGIHGVQDMCNLLRRNGKPFIICAGHYEKSDVIDRVYMACKSAKIAKTLKTAKIGIIGDQFEGMGDFGLPFELLKEKLGMDVVSYDSDAPVEVSEREIDEEYAADTTAYNVSPELTNELYRDVTKIGLGVRKWIEREKLTGYTMNFLSTKAGTPFGKMPFAEASKSLAAGIGYAGEGDVMTAALVGSLLKIYEYTSFVEMFCPDWEGGSVFLNHMGEFNLKCSTGTLDMAVKPFPYTDAGDTYAVTGTFMPGKTLFCCLAPQKDGKFTLIIAKGKMLKLKSGVENRQSCGINGWFKPKNFDIADFLAEYSRNGGIHHAAMVWGGDIDVIANFGRLAGFDIVTL